MERRLIDFEELADADATRTRAIMPMGPSNESESASGKTIYNSSSFIYLHPDECGILSNTNYIGLPILIKAALMRGSRRRINEPSSSLGSVVLLSGSGLLNTRRLCRKCQLSLRPSHPVRGSHFRHCDYAKGVTYECNLIYLYVRVSH